MNTSKKILLTLSFMVFGWSNAQFTLKDSSGNTIEDNQTFSFDTVDESAELKFRIQNNESSTLLVRGEMLEMEGTDGSNVQFCMQDCLFSVQVGSIVPVTGGFSVAPNALSPQYGTYFWNKNDSSDFKRYKFKIYAIDSFGNEYGTPVHITYVYDKYLSIDEQTQSQFELYPTSVKSVATINLKEAAVVQIINLDGKIVKSFNLPEGSSELGLEELATGVYFVSLKGKSGVSKIVKQ